MVPKVVSRDVALAEVPAAFEEKDPLAGFGQYSGSDATAEAGADDDDVVLTHSAVGLAGSRGS